jgi:hypothetical protein
MSSAPAAAAVTAVAAPTPCTSFAHIRCTPQATPQTLSHAVSLQGAEEVQPFYNRAFNPYIVQCIQTEIHTLNRNVLLGEACGQAIRFAREHVHKLRKSYSGLLNELLAWIKIDSRLCWLRDYVKMCAFSHTFQYQHHIAMWCCILDITARYRASMPASLLRITDGFAQYWQRDCFGILMSPVFPPMETEFVHAFLKLAHPVAYRQIRADHQPFLYPQIGDDATVLYLPTSVLALAYLAASTTRPAIYDSWNRILAMRQNAQSPRLAGQLNLLWDVLLSTQADPDALMESVLAQQPSMSDEPFVEAVTTWTNDMREANAEHALRAIEMNAIFALSSLETNARQASAPTPTPTPDSTSVSEPHQPAHLYRQPHQPAHPYEH